MTRTTTSKPAAEPAFLDFLRSATEQVDRVSRYIGPSEHRPSLTRLGSQEWPRAKARVRRAVAELAKDLLELYASREVAEGHPFPPDTAWQTELEASFPYVETPDQLRALGEVKSDMERPRPMDRVLVGDVGYGKTEIALRAAFKAVEAGKKQFVGSEISGRRLGVIGLGAIGRNVANAASACACASTIGSRARLRRDARGARGGTPR